MIGRRRCSVARRAAGPARAALASLGLFACAGATAGSAASSPPTLTITTYNLRVAVDAPPRSWPERLPLIGSLVRGLAPDVLGTQEGRYGQVTGLAAELPGYAWIGEGRRGGNDDEFTAVFYRRSRLEALAFRNFWLSDTPAVAGSTTWGNQLPRMVTQVKFRDRASGVEFHVFNTHFDHQSEEARARSAQLIRQCIAVLEPNAIVLVLGDFNSPAGNSAAYSTLTRDGGLSDAWLAADRRSGAGIGTFNDFTAAVPGGPRIDWILTRGPVSVSLAELTTSMPGGRFPSDHFPVTVRLAIAGASERRR